MGVDWRLPLDEASRRLGRTLPLQGNIDPALLAAPWPVLEAHILDVLERGTQRPAHVVNLGHGVPPDTDPTVLTRIVEFVHALADSHSSSAAASRGLVVARRLALAGRSVTLFEASDRLGGTVARHEVAGSTWMPGPRPSPTRGGDVAALLAELGLGADIVEPRPGPAWLQPVAGTAVPLPATACSASRPIRSPPTSCA